MQRLLLALIAVYRYFFSPWMGGCCRFTPSCSEYAREAVLRFGAAKGGLLALLRLARCHPLCRSGFDPVPQTFTWLGLLPRRRAGLTAK